MGAFSSTLTSSRQHTKSLLLMSSTSRNNTISLPVQNQQSLPVLAPAKPDQTPIDIITTRDSDSASTGDNRANSEHITEQLQPVSIAVVSGLFALLANPPPSVHNHITLYKIYLFFYLLSFVSSIVPLVITLITKPSLDVASWLQKQAMRIATVFIVISVTLRIFLLLPPPIVWYDVLIPLLAVGAVSLCLRYGWIKAKNSTQTSSSPAVTSSFTSEV